VRHHQPQFTLPAGAQRRHTTYGISEKPEILGAELLDFVPVAVEAKNTNVDETLLKKNPIQAKNPLWLRW